MKVLDFGLAKAVGGEGSSPDLTHAPDGDIESRRRTAPSSALPAYMSPEQARGLPVDRRTDIWAFGCVVYEMLTGRVTFAGETVSDSIAKILEREPDWSALPATTPASIRRLLLRCLAKDPKKRLRDIADVRIEIDAVEEVLPGSVLTPASRSGGEPCRAVAAVGRRSRRLAVAIGAVGSPAARSCREPAALRGLHALDRLGRLRRARRDLARRQGRRLHRRSRRRARFLCRVSWAPGIANNLTTTARASESRLRSCEGPASLPIRPGCGSTSCRDKRWRCRGHQAARRGIFSCPGAHTPAWSTDDRLVLFRQYGRRLRC